jgi:hypothetical protein
MGEGEGGGGQDENLLVPPPLLPLPPKDCVAIGEIEKNVMLNLVQHLTKSRT